VLTDKTVHSNWPYTTLLDKTSKEDAFTVTFQLTHSLQATIPEKHCKYHRLALVNQATAQLNKIVIP
jgi:hypothetical protein